MSDLKCIQTPVRLPAHKKWRLKVALKVTLSISQPGRKFVKDDVSELCLRDTSHQWLVLLAQHLTIRLSQ